MQASSLFRAAPSARAAAAAKPAVVHAGCSGRAIIPKAYIKYQSAIEQRTVQDEAWGLHRAVNGLNESPVGEFTAIDFSLSGGLLTNLIRKGLVTNTGELVIKDQPKGKVRFDVDGYRRAVFKDGLIGRWFDISGTSDMWFESDSFPWMSQEDFCHLYWETKTNPEPTSMEATVAWCACLINRFDMTLEETLTSRISNNIIPTPSCFKARATPTPRSSGSGGNGSRHMLTAVGGGEEGSRRMLQRCKSVRVSATGDDELMC